MNPVQAFEVGIAPQHLPALVAALLLPLLVVVVRRLRPGRVEPDAAPPARRIGPVNLWAAWLLGITAAVHLALPLGHVDGLPRTIAFLGGGAAYAWLAMRAIEGRSWRLLSSLLLAATLIAYLSVAATGEEEPDQVGIATALVELVALGLCLIPARQPGRPRRFLRFLSSAGALAATFLVGALIWVGSFAAHAATDTSPTTVGAVGHTGDHEHGHDHTARAQAGVIMRPVADSAPSAAQRAAADRLAAATTEAMRRYARLDDAIAAGYKLPKPGTGPDVHLDNEAFRKDGRTLDPQRPETLVYAISGGRATLLGVVFVMERAGFPGPEPGGPITRWHAHNICLTALPPGFGIVSPFGTCPALSVQLTTPEMMHVWVVENPSGAFAEGLDADWVFAYNVAHGLPYHAA